MALCQIPGCEAHYACRMRNKGLQVSPRVQMTRTQNWRPTPSVPVKSNGDYMYDIRADGSKMPIIMADGTHMQRYDYNLDATKIDSVRHAIQAPE